MGQVEGGRGHAGSVAEDAPACGGGEHGVAEAVDEVGGCCRFGEGGDQVWGGLCEIGDRLGGLSRGRNGWDLLAYHLVEDLEGTSGRSRSASRLSRAA